MAKEDLFGVSDMGTEWREKTIDRIESNPTASNIIGSSIRVMDEGKVIEFEVEGGAKKCMRNEFVLVGSNERPVMCRLEVFKSGETDGWEERFLFVDVPKRGVEPSQRLTLVAPRY
jgi:hypothetical protein